MRAFLTGFALSAGLAISSMGRAQGNPVVVEYMAPPECASNEAFHALLQAQIARSDNPERGWRFSVSIRHESDYVGVLKTETGTRELRAPTCDDVTAALSLVIAMAQPDLPEPPPPPPPITPIAPTPLPPVTLTPTPPPTLVPPLVAPRDVPRVENAKPDPQWRIGARFEHWSDGSTIGFNGAFITGGVELPYGFPKMHFEVGLGALYWGYSNPINYFPTGPNAGDGSGRVLLGLLDTQACPIDLPIAHTGIDIMGCGRLTAGLTKGILSNSDFGLGAWAGGGARLRWQTPWHAFVETHFDGLYGTRVWGVPAMMDFGGSVGFRI